MATAGPKVLVVDDDESMCEAKVSSVPRPPREEA
jgi:hypothetical protein